MSKKQSASTIKVNNWKVVDFNIDLPKDKIYDTARHLLPKRFTPGSAEFEVHGVSTPVANAIRRTILTELPAKMLDFTYESFTKTNAFSLVDKLQMMIRSIPIDQDTPIDAEFTLYVKNETNDILHVYSKDIKIRGASQTGKERAPFSPNYILDDLEPGKFIKIDKITVVSNYGYVHAGHSLASHAICKPLDVQPFNAHTGQGQRVSISDPRAHIIKFTYYGTMPPANIIRLVIDEMERRLTIIRDKIPTLLTIDTASNITHKLDLPGETATTLVPIVKQVIEDNPTPDLTITYSNQLIRIKTSGDPKEILTTSVTNLINTFKKIREQFEKQLS